MILKILIFLIVIFLIYLVFFKTKRPNLKKDSKKRLDAQTLVECETCKTFVSVNEAIIKNGKYYCSKECAKKQ